MKSACPGLSKCFIFSYFEESTSLLQIIIEIGVPAVLPSNTPLNISTLSASFLGLITSLCPGDLLSSSFCTSSSLSSSPAGQPSTTTPIALPWLSPHVVILNRLPNVLVILLQLHPHIMHYQVTSLLWSKA